MKRYELTDSFGNINCIVFLDDAIKGSPRLLVTTATECWMTPYFKLDKYKNFEAFLLEVDASYLADKLFTFRNEQKTAFSCKRWAEHELSILNEDEVYQNHPYVEFLEYLIDQSAKSSHITRPQAIQEGIEHKKLSFYVSDKEFESAQEPTAEYQSIYKALVELQSMIRANLEKRKTQSEEHIQFVNLLTNPVCPIYLTLELEKTLSRVIGVEYVIRDLNVCKGSYSDDITFNAFPCDDNFISDDAELDPENDKAFGWLTNPHYIHLEDN